MPASCHISELQTAVQEVTDTFSHKQPNKGWTFRAGGNFLSLFSPFAKVSWSWRHISKHLTHAEALLYFASFHSWLFRPLSFLALVLWLSDCNARQHRSTGRDLSLTTTRNRKLESEPGGERRFYSADAESFGLVLHLRDVRILVFL